MSNETSPRPWSFVDPFDDGFPVVRDANERQVATLDVATPDLNEANAALIVAAVNERDRLRNAIRYICNTARHALGYLDAVAPREAFMSIAPSDLRNILEIARAAIGEDKP